jgi:hypothetical protein
VRLRPNRGFPLGLALSCKFALYVALDLKKGSIILTDLFWLALIIRPEGAKIA